jgi:hypothetical protein
VGLLVTVAFAIADARRRAAGGTPTAERGGTAKFLWGFLVSATLWLAGLVGLVGFPTWFIDHGHYIAAIGLFVCMFIVTVANAFRRDGPAPMMRRPARLDRYAVLAWVMAGAGLLMGALWLFNVLTAFWPEAVVTALFLAFWVVQTLELLDAENAAQADATPTVAVP